MKIQMPASWSYFRLLLLVAIMAALPQARADEAPKLAPALQPFVDDHSLAGAVLLVADSNKVIALEAVGWMDIAAQEPMHTNSLFWIASITKSVTATLIMMLVDEGKVSVDDPVEKYLPEFKNPQLSVKHEDGTVLLTQPEHLMTVRNLLNHTSGISHDKLPRQIKDKDIVPLREAVEGYAKNPLESDPGSKYAYSNPGIDTLGRIIEVASGMSYEEFMDQRLLKPLGMQDTTFWPTDEQIQRLAKAYMPDAQNSNSLMEAKTIGYFTYPLNNRKRQPFPAGGLFSTATDLSLFCRMLLNGGVYKGHRYISMKSLQEMTSTQTGDMLNQGKNEDGYGYGWQTARKLRDTDARLEGAFGHGGAYGTEVWVDPRRSRIRIFLVQFEGGLPSGETGKRMKSAFVKAANEVFTKAPDQ